jgi:hypothetical protein
LKVKIIAVAMLFLLVAGIISIAAHTSQVYADPILAFNPSTYTEHYTTTTDTFFDVFVEISGVTSLYGFEIKISWDPTLIAFNSESHSTYLDAIWTASNWYEAINEHGTNSTAGYYRLVAVSQGATFDGTAILLDLNFKVLDPGTNSKKTTALHFETNKLSDKQYQAIPNTPVDGTVNVWGKTPKITFDQTSIECQKIQTFTITVSISDAIQVTGVQFDIRYSSLLLDVLSVSWGVWGSGTEDHSIDGTVTGSSSGAPQDGTPTLFTITFNASYAHDWKDTNTVIGYENIVLGSIYLQTATLYYASLDPLAFVHSGSGNTINYGGDVSYTWSPIQGDVNLDGKVNLQDLRDVAFVYDQYDAYYNLTGATDLVDIYDLVVVANNFGFGGP